MRLGGVVAVLMILGDIPSILAAQSPRPVISGTVADSAGVPIGYTSVMVDGKVRVVAMENGSFRFEAERSRGLVVDFRRIGFEPVSLRFDVAPDSALRIVMRRLAHTVEAVRVVAQRIQSLELRGFYERVTDVKRGINNGFFITPEEIESRPGARVTDFFGGHAGVRVKLARENGVGRRTGLEAQGLDGCRMTVYVDGVRFHTLNKQGLEQGSINFINDLLTANTIAGMEVYPRSVSAPPRYQSLNGTCGVILIWTR